MKKLLKNEVCGTCEQYISHCSWLKSQQYAAEKEKRKKKGKHARRRETCYPNKHYDVEALFV